MKFLLGVLVVASVLLSTQAGSITRNKRGYLSRTGICPDPAGNFQKKDVRLNYWGIAVIREGDSEDAPCTDSECNEDSHCDGNRKCCKNYCGASVCTISTRDPDPCANFHCPGGQTCKIQKVKCVMPECPDATAVNRPTCIPTAKLEATNTATLGDFQADTTEALQKYRTMQNDDTTNNDKAAYTGAQNDDASYAAPDPYAATPDAAAMPTPDVAAMQAPMIENAAGAQSVDALSYADQQQSYAAPMDQSSMSSIPTDTANIAQVPMDTSNYAPVPNPDTANFGTRSQLSSILADKPSPDAQVVAQAPAQPGSSVESS